MPFPLIVLAAALFGFIARLRRQTAPAADRPISPSVRLRQTLATAVTWLAIWVVPLAALAAVFGPSHVLSQIALFFSKLAVVTFGGAYAVLAYMAQDVVESYGWLTRRRDAGRPRPRGDDAGAADPGHRVRRLPGRPPAWRRQPWVMGVLGAVVTLWATFAPCFLWIFAGAPYIERLNAEPRLKAALAAVTAAVVGVILNLTVWFALHVLFAQRERALRLGPLRLHGAGARVRLLAGAAALGVAVCCCSCCTAASSRRLPCAGPGVALGSVALRQALWQRPTASPCA